MQGGCSVFPTRRRAPMHLLFLDWGSVVFVVSVAPNCKWHPPALTVLFRNQVIQPNQFIFSALGRFDALIL